MAEFKLVIGFKSGQCAQKEAKENNAKALLGKKLGDKINGNEIGFDGYEFEITGGSDYCGFPMRNDVQGKGRKSILAIEGVGLKKKGKGIRQRKTVCGNLIHEKISQINLKVLKEGKEKLIAPKEAEAPKTEAPSAEAPKPEAPAKAAAPAKAEAHAKAAEPAKKE